MNRVAISGKKIGVLLIIAVFLVLLVVPMLWSTTFAMDANMQVDEQEAAEAVVADAEGICYGIIGHVQHLKCYASQADAVYKNADGTPIDPRWKYVVSKRGSAPNVEDLENNWAAAIGYSLRIYDLLAALMGTSAEPAAMEETVLEGNIVGEAVVEELEQPTPLPPQEDKEQQEPLEPPHATMVPENVQIVEPDAESK